MVENAWTIDGRIHCAKKRPRGLSERESPRRIFTIDTPDDLFKLGVDAVDFEEPNKACGHDQIINEFLKASTGKMTDIYETILFDSLFW